jgi:lycopene beta-cyclase
MIFDVIITGGGAAGLSMIAHMIKSGDWQDKSIAFIDQNIDSPLDKTWCFWDNQIESYLPVAYAWNRLAVIEQDIQITHSLGNLTYYEIRSEDYHASVMDMIKGCPNIQLIEDTIDSIISVPSGTEVIGKRGVYQGKFIVNSVQGVVGKQLPKFALTQNFLGYRIQCKEAKFDPQTVKLMHFNEKDSSFFYVLPYSKHEALVEYTRLSNQVENERYYFDKIDDYLQSEYGIDQYTVSYKEFGVIPMTMYPFESNPLPGVYQIGTIGGNTKPTTGYTFKSILQRCEEISRAIRFNEPLPNKSRRFQFYDRLLLQIIDTHPQEVPNIMMRLFESNSAHLLLRFLDEKTTLQQELSIFWRLPWKPFIRTLFSAKKYFYENLPANRINKSVGHTV